MKRANVFFSMMFASITLHAQVFQVSKLTSVINQCNKDSVLKTERVAALKFHKLINEYRIKNKIDTLEWDDVLWLAARNHSVWMGTNNQLSHSEKEGTINFTGTGPGERYDYASVNGTSDWSGENALYNWSDDGSTLEEISSQMASESFTQWKNSPGHDQNMRAQASRSHAVAFYLEPQGAVWATDLFSYTTVKGEKPADVKQLALSEKEISKVSHTKPDKKIKAKRLSANEIEIIAKNIVSQLEITSSAKKIKFLKTAALRHAKYMADSKNLTHNEKKDFPAFYAKNEKKRVMKASLGLFFFSENKVHLYESIAKVKTEVNKIDVSELSDALIASLDAEKKVSGIPVSSGFGVSIRQEKGELKIYAVRLEGMKLTAPRLNELSNK